MANSDHHSFETETAEYKFYIPNKITLARNIAAFANTKGGQIYIGYIPTEEGSLNFTGLMSDQVQEAIERVEEVLRYLNPSPLIDIKTDTTVENKRFVVVNIQKHPVPVLFNRRYYVRQGNQITVAEEELIDVLSETIPSFKQNILDSLHAEESAAEKREDSTQPANPLGEYNIEIREAKGMATGDNTIVVQHFGEGVKETIEEKPQLDLNVLLKDSIQQTREDLTTQRNERFQQARITFIVAIVVLVLAVLLVFVGVILIFFNKTQAGVVSSVASIVSGIVSGLALVFNKQTNDRMDEYAKELVVLEKSYTAMQYISLITDIKTKDEAIRDLAKSISQGNQPSISG